MKRQFYHTVERNIQTNKSFNKFNMLFESIMSGLPAYENTKDDPLLFIRRPDLNLILEDIKKPCYIVSESTGDAILFEKALFMDDSQLITEGILDSVVNKAKEYYEKIANALTSILKESSDAIQKFLNELMNSSIVKAIREKFGLDKKVGKENFKQYVTVKNAKGEVITESVFKRANIITEATKLSKKEEAITDPNEVKQYIQKYEDALSGKKIINNAKTGKPLSSQYLKQKLNLFKNKLASLQNGEAQKSANTKQNEQPEKKQQIVEGTAEINSQGVVGQQKQTVNEVLNSSNSDFNTSTQDANKIEDEGVQQTTEPKEEKKGFLAKVKNVAKNTLTSAKNAVSKVTDSAGNWLKEKIKNNKWLKYLIIAVIALMTVFAMWWIITAVIMPAFALILHGGVAGALAGGGAIWHLVVAGKTFKATYKAGQKAWESGSGWGKFFMMCGASILAATSLKMMSSKLQSMQADLKSAKTTNAENTENAKGSAENTSEKSQSSSEESNNNSGNTESSNTNQSQNTSNEGEISDGEEKILQQEEMMGQNYITNRPKVTQLANGKASISGYIPKTDKTYYKYLREYAKTHDITRTSQLRSAKTWAELQAKKALVNSNGASYDPVEGTKFNGED